MIENIWGKKDGLDRTSSRCVRTTDIISVPMGHLELIASPLRWAGLGWAAHHKNEICDGKKPYIL